MRHQHNRPAPTTPDPTLTSVHLSRWRNDTSEGFSECELIYDKEGRLLGVDFKTERPVPRSSH